MAVSAVTGVFADIVAGEEPFLTSQVNDRLAFLQVAIQKHRFELLLIGDEAHVAKIVDALNKCRRTVGIEFILRGFGRREEHQFRIEVLSLQVGRGSSPLRCIED